jgi:hypothetical protein
MDPSPIETQLPMSHAMARLFVFRSVLLVLLASCILSLTGCATREDDEVSQRPWNSPKRWENGLPSAITEGR